jgi:RHS repeat-associated protein
MANGVLSVMVYDASGKLVAEYGTPSSQTGGTQYVFADHQGSTRVTLNQAGGVVARHDYQPFGEEIYAGTGLRSTTQGYDQSESVRQKYAGMERDESSGLSHTLWRKYDAQSGRWTTPDPYGGSMEIADPQSFNRYSYVQNDPVNKVDLLGLMLSDIGIYQTTNERVARGLEYQCVLNLRFSRSQSSHGSSGASNLNEFASPAFKASMQRSGGRVATVYSRGDNQNDRDAFANRAKDITPDERFMRSFGSGWEAKNALEQMSALFGPFDVINFLGHAFPPGMLGTSEELNDNNGIFIEYAGNAAYTEPYAFRVGGTRALVFSNYVNERNRRGGMITTNDLAQSFGREWIKMSHGGQINFYGCETYRLASHVSYLLGLNNRSDISVSGTKGSCYLGGGPIVADDWQTYRNGVFIK